MMKKGLLILLCLPLMTLAQQTYVPDDNFENYLETTTAWGMPVSIGDPNSMGDGTINDYVTTANINTVTTLEITNWGIADLTGIEDFTALDDLRCYSNQLTSLDLTTNTALTFLDCSDNQLTIIDVSNNPAIRTLSCHNNQLTNLDVSNITDLTSLYCYYNQLTCLDISNNTDVDWLHCSNNLLEQLNTKNGNWVNSFDMEADSNNLTCVEVDNIGYANSNWNGSFDSFVTFSTNCNYTNPCATISSIQEHSTNKELLTVTDLLGRETNDTKNEVLFYIYDNGTVEKRKIIE